MLSAVRTATDKDLRPSPSKLASMQELIWNLNVLRSKVFANILAELRESQWNLLMKLRRTHRVQSLCRVETPVKMLTQQEMDCSNSRNLESLDLAAFVFSL